MLRLLFRSWSEFRGGDRDSEREVSFFAALRGGVRDAERDDELGLRALLVGGERSRTGALPFPRGGEAERVYERPLSGRRPSLPPRRGGEREREDE